MSKRFWLTAVFVIAVNILPLQSFALTISPPYTLSYSAIDLGSVPGLPPPTGGLTLKAADNNTLLIGGEANTTSAAIYSVGLTRAVDNHIMGFSGPATFFAHANGVTGGIDGGLAYGPGGVLFYSSFPDNRAGEIKPGSIGPDKLVDLTALGVGPSVGALNFVPPGFGSAGTLKIVSFDTGQFYTATLTPDGSGTFNITSVTLEATLSGGPEGFVYVAAGNPQFPVDTMLVSELSANRVSAYEIDAAGNPKPATRKDFITGLDGVEGAFIDPLTGDFLFSTFGGGDRVIVVQGFLAPAPPPSSVPEPTTLSLLAIGLAGLASLRRRNRS